MRTAIVLLHGYLCLSPQAYWRGLGPVRQVLAGAGAEIVVGNAPRTGGVASRAERVARHLATLPHRHLVLVGHSMGGLDARYVASRLDPDRRIRRVITIGTPHRGSAAAEWALGRNSWATPLLRLVDRGALRDLTRDGARLLETAMPDRPDVAYRAVLGRCLPGELVDSFGDLARYVAAAEGDSDGVVSIHSAARWPNPVLMNADHFGLIGHTIRWGIAWRNAPHQRVHGPVVQLMLDDLARQRPAEC